MPHLCALTSPPQGGASVAYSLAHSRRHAWTGSLLTRGAAKVTREELAQLATPEATDTFKPDPHHQLVASLEEALTFRHIQITEEEYCIAKDGNRLIGFLKVNAEYEGITFGIGVRNAHDKSMRLGLVAGYRVTVCSNMAFAGDFKPMRAKHSKNFDLIDTLPIGVDRIQRSWQPLRGRVDFMRNKVLPITTAQALIYRAFTEAKFPVRLLKSVHANYFLPKHEEFKPRTVWSLSNAFTSAFKEAKDDKRYELTAHLGRFLDPYCNPANFYAAEHSAQNPATESPRLPHEPLKQTTLPPAVFCLLEAVS